MFVVVATTSEASNKPAASATQSFPSSIPQFTGKQAKQKVSFSLRVKMNVMLTFSQCRVPVN